MSAGSPTVSQRVKVQQVIHLNAQGPCLLKCRSTSHVHVWLLSFVRRAWFAFTTRVCMYKNACDILEPLTSFPPLTIVRPLIHHSS